MTYNSEVLIGTRAISISSPTYFIADIAANHDGDLERAKNLIYLAKESGADCAKFQHFMADKIVSDYGFRHLPVKNQSHQASWGKSVFAIYKEYECHRDWTYELAETAQEVGIEFMTTPYDNDAIKLVDPYVNAYKIGSGDITWIDFLRTVAMYGKTILLATGASSLQDVERAVSAILRDNSNMILMQCNTNYTASPDNLKCVNLNVLKKYAALYPDMPLGLSDHTSGYTSVLGAVSLGARVIEKHFTDDNSRVGPDHKFAMNPDSWSEMVKRTRELEFCLGDGVKRVESNEQDTVVVQRRCMRATRALKIGDMIQTADFEALRPAPKDAVFPYEYGLILGKKIKVNKDQGDYLKRGDVDA